MSDLRIALASDHAGFELKQRLAEHLRGSRGEAQVIDLGPASAGRCDYPDFAVKVAEAVNAGDADFGVLVCGSGIGISIAANKVPGARAALVHDETTARLARQHNDARIVCLGARIVGESVAIDCVEAFLRTAFEGGRHADRVAKIHAIERRPG